MKSDRVTKKSTARENKTSSLTLKQARTLLPRIPGWNLSGKALVRTFQFQNYYETMAFVNATAWVSHRENHHPDLEVGYNKVTMRYSTHSVGGLSESDFICAAKISQLITLET